MLNKDIYTKAPEQNRLVNNGVAEVSEDHSEAAQSVLRYELETFVCDGQYEEGLATILARYLSSLQSGLEQPGFWISGFFGSGKSHLAKMLRTLWTDYSFTDGATARSLAKLPASVTDSLKELTIRSKAHGGLHAAAGKLGAGAGDKVRLALLGIVFKSAGLPEQYAQARFVMWLKREGLLDQVQTELKTQKRSLEQELPHLYVSSHLAKALLKAQPEFADNELAARQFIKAQYPQVADVSSDEMLAAINDALTVDGKFPLTVIVLDEVQQYADSNTEKTFQIQEVTESLCKHFKGNLLFVGTGQSALSGTPTLMRLMARFPNPVMLGDYDVENVTRQIILAKKPSAQPAVEKVWRDHLGEISRHLRGTKFEHVTTDENDLTSDYPLLPVRRRFWERILRTIDATGTVSQLRSQLRVVHEAVLATADQSLGHVVSGDFLYDQIAGDLLSTGQLPTEVFNNVGRFSEGDAGSQLKARLLKLIFLINKLPPDVALAYGIRATENVLADLLVTDLASGSSDLRKAIPPLLDELQNKDLLVMALAGADGIEYRLQTRESSAWYDEYRTQETELKAAPQRIELQRADLLKSRFRDILGKVRVVQGIAMEERKLNLSFDETLPKDHAKNLYLWIQDGWQTDEKSVIAEARANGSDDPSLFAFLPAQHKTDIVNALVALAAAKATLSKKGAPSTEEGRDAQRSMESRQRAAEKDLARLLDQLFAGVRLFQSGGHEVTDGNDLAERLNRAAKASAVRLYREFDVADNDKWDKVLVAARDGNAEALKAVGHTQEVERHPVCQKILAFIGPGKKGAEIRDHFEAPRYGWPRDAIDGAVYVLLGAGHLRATDAASRPVDVKSLDRSKLTQASFRQESINISPPQLIKIRQLFNALGIACQPKEELAKAPLLIAKFRELASKAGGTAPAPHVPDVAAVEVLEAQSGNGLLLEIFTHHDELGTLAKQWQKTATAMNNRLAVWNELSRLLDHARDLGPYAELKAEADAILAQRSLLAEPDPIHPLRDRVADLLRKALNAKHKAYSDVFDKRHTELDADADWSKLEEKQRAKLAAAHHLQPLPPVQLATAEQIQEALDDCNLEHWISRSDALGSRFDAARLGAVQLLKPNVTYVALPRRTLNNRQELDVWLDEVKTLLAEKLDKGPVAL